jgi:hypothetical protein
MSVSTTSTVSDAISCKACSPSARVHLVAGVAQHGGARQVEIGFVVDQQNAERQRVGGVGHFRTPNVGMTGRENKG